MVAKCIKIFIKAIVVLNYCLYCKYNLQYTYKLNDKYKSFLNTFKCGKSLCRPLVFNQSQAATSTQSFPCFVSAMIFFACVESARLVT